MMEDYQNTYLGVKLPLSDYILISLYVMFLPLIISVGFLGLGSVVDNNFTFLFSLSIFVFILSGIVFYFYYKYYIELREYALEVGYFHFKPSWKDLLLNLLFQTFSIAILTLILIFLFESYLMSNQPLWINLGIGIFISISFQLFIIVLSMNAKRKLLLTAQEPIEPALRDQIRNHDPPFKTIYNMDIFYADIKPASLFLSAGVMTMGRKNIALVSRYFNWKLTDDELIAVLSHEEGHITINHMRKSYLLLGVDGLFRALRIFSILTALVLFLNNTLFELNLLLLSILIPIIILAFISSAALAHMQHYRMYLQEIQSDAYGAALVGNEILALTLKKLPKVIPAPIDDTPLNFLGFRIAILRNRAKKIGEDIPQNTGQFSRFSNN